MEECVMSAGPRRYLAVGAFALLLCLPSVGRGQVALDFTWNQLDMQTFFVADFIDLAQETYDVSSHPELFTAILTNTSGVSQYVAVRITFGVENLNAGNLAESYPGLAMIETTVFEVPATGRIFTNRDISDQASDIGILDSTVDEDATGDLKDLILQTGLLPSGRYIFDIELLDAERQLIQVLQRTRWVSNPTRVDLVGPGDEFGQTLPVVATSTPQFFWSTDATASTINTRFQIRVVRVEDATSAEEAMSAFAVWEEEVTNRMTAVYPSSVDAIPLEAGASYAWQVLRIVETSSGSVDIESPIYWFKMEDPAAGVIGASVDEEVDQMIDQIQEMQGVGDQLEGYRPTGQVIVDGQPMNLNALRNLLEQVLNGQLQIGTIIIR
jgi:hypothetical protein